VATGWITFTVDRLVGYTNTPVGSCVLHHTAVVCVRTAMPLATPFPSRLTNTRRFDTVERKTMWTLLARPESCAVCSLIVTWLLSAPLFRLGASYTLHLSVCLSVYFVQHDTDSDLLRLDFFVFKSASEITKFLTRQGSGNRSRVPRALWRRAAVSLWHINGCLGTKQ